MWSQHGFWNNLEAGGGGGYPGYYPGYEQELSSLYKHYGYPDQPGRQQQEQASSASQAVSTPVQERFKEAELQQLTPPDSDSEREREDKPFRCGYPRCSYETNRRNNLKRHMATMHERLSSPHTCCGVTFFRKADMRAHTKVGLNITTGHFITFSMLLIIWFSLTILSINILSQEVHSEGYPCTWPGCGKGFVRKALLDRHLKIHTGEKPFVCPVCQYGTSHKSNLDRHVRIHFKSPTAGSPAKQLYPGPGHLGLYEQLHHHSPFLAPAWARSQETAGKEAGQGAGTLPDSTTEPAPAASSPARRQSSFLFSPDKFPVPFSPCTLDSITPLKLSPVKSAASAARLQPELGLEAWWSPAAAHFSPGQLPGSLGLTPNTSAETEASSRAASFLSAPGTPPTPGSKRAAGEAFISHGIRSILGEQRQQEEDEEEVDVDGDSEEDYEDGDEDDYVPKKLRLARKHSFSEV